MSVTDTWRPNIGKKSLLVKKRESLLSCTFQQERMMHRSISYKKSLFFLPVQHGYSQSPRTRLTRAGAVHAVVARYNALARAATHSTMVAGASYDHGPGAARLLYWYVTPDVAADAGVELDQNGGGTPSSGAWVSQRGREWTGADGDGRYVHSMVWCYAREKRVCCVCCLTSHQAIKAQTHAHAHARCECEFRAVETGFGWRTRAGLSRS